MASQLADISAAVYPVAMIVKIISGGQTGVGTEATIDVHFIVLANGANHGRRYAVPCTS